MHSGNLQAVLDMVLSHQGLPLKAELTLRLMTALVLPDPAYYRPLLRRMTALRTKGSEKLVLRAQNLLVRGEGRVLRVQNLLVRGGGGAQGA